MSKFWDKVRNHDKNVNFSEIKIKFFEVLKSKFGKEVKNIGKKSEF